MIPKSEELAALHASRASQFMGEITLN